MDFWRVSANKSQSSRVRPLMHAYYKVKELLNNAFPNQYIIHVYTFPIVLAMR